MSAKKRSGDTCAMIKAFFFDTQQFMKRNKDGAEKTIYLDINEYGYIAPKLLHIRENKQKRKQRFFEANNNCITNLKTTYLKTQDKPDHSRNLCKKK